MMTKYGGQPGCAGGAGGTGGGEEGLLIPLFIISLVPIEAGV